MSLRIFINDREYTSPVVKYGLAVAVFVGALAVSALIVFVLLPTIGITLVLSLGIFIVIAVAAFSATVALTIGGVLFAALLTLTEKLMGRSGRT